MVDGVMLMSLAIQSMKMKHQRLDLFRKIIRTITSPTGITAQQSSSSSTLKPRERVSYEDICEIEDGELSENSDHLRQQSEEDLRRSKKKVVLERGRHEERSDGRRGEEDREEGEEDDADEPLKEYQGQEEEEEVVEEEEKEGELDSVEEALLDLYESIPAPKPPRPHPIRLLALPNPRTNALEPDQNVLILEPENNEPLVIGRDRTFGPSLRLKEMEVSKTHLTIYWQSSDGDDSQGWFVVDNGSTHGTFFISSDSSRSEKDPERLSKQKRASRPLRLHHLDTILIASSEDPILAFQVHIHPKFPTSCQSCALRPDESNRIKLALPISSQTDSEKRQVVGGIDLDGSRHAFMNPTDVKVDRERKRKAEMARLRNQFFGDDSPPQAGLNKRKRMMTMARAKNLDEMTEGEGSGEQEVESESEERCDEQKLYKGSQHPIKVFIYIQYYCLRKSCPNFSKLKS
ncbi:expressed protein [Phakopsora pachyrhizi]|uniref:Expressed protein n=1 Tax=Phakopsora pachyrhizi TaxID=170000 RepID=A0AAV0AND2_PHAPC|nr:expressed protein [Phakopsora pachyrhizi]